MHIVLVEAGILISHTEVKSKELYHEGEWYKVYGLSGVFTYPAFRGQGYGTEVIRAGTKYIDEQDGDVGMVHCNPELSGFYERCGLITMNVSVMLEGDPKKPIVSDHLLTMRFLSEKGKRHSNANLCISARRHGRRTVRQGCSGGTVRIPDLIQFLRNLHGRK